MRFCLLFLLCFFTTTAAWSQLAISSNSFSPRYKQTNPEIIYQYDSLKQIHNYSNNWDIDNDGKTDQLYFVGTGGAHLYYFLRVILSSDDLVRDFPFIQSDLPVLPSAAELSKPGFDPAKNWTQFLVFDFDKDKKDDIFIRLDHASFETEKNLLKIKGIKTSFVIITFNNGKTFFKDFSNKTQ